MTTRNVLAATILLGVAPGLWAQSVSPGKLFAGKLLNVRAPNSEGWKLITSSGATLAFARAGASSNESYAAQVTLFAIAESKNPEEFVSLIKNGAEADAPPDRFNNLESSYEYTDQRGYDCVRVKSVTEDTKARTSFFSRESLKLQAASLYCKHPRQAGAAFVAAFSHRGETLDSELESQAQSFIEGVQVPDQ
ncbi:MAG: hypothetical protein PHY45_09035 [Rhodocyclaceae bacterium]|nr:hypothetical protein [Rhodocyclaceae bacterium]